MNKVSFNLKTIQNLLDMIQNRDYIIDNLELQISDLRMDSAGDDMDRQEFVEALYEIARTLEYSINEVFPDTEDSEYLNLKHAVAKTVEKLRKLISDYE